MADYYGSVCPESAKDSFNIEDVIVKEGEVAEEILKTADEYGCNLIVMGAHTGPFGAVALGSATRDVLQRSKVPVFIIPVSQEG